MKWVAIYNDETFLAQFNEDGSENKYADIDRNRLTHFAMLGEGNKPVLVIEMERPTQKLIYRRRTFMDLVGNIKGVIFLVGWHENINGKSIKVINYIYPDGRIVLAGAKDDLELVQEEF
jgi:hypothetical protein